MEKSRKYILNICNNISCGLGTCTTTDQTYNLLNSFVNDGITYSVLTEEELSVLSKLDYEDRVLNFIDYINIEDSSQKEALFTGATTINNPDCLPYYCYLNSKFQVYKFFDGIRIINAGVANFTLQYQVYLLSESNEEHPWQTSPTFLGLNSNEVYVIKIRDYSPDDDIVICEYSQTVSMQLILGNTTTTISNKVLSLTQCTDNLVNNNCYKTGVFTIDPNLLNFQRLTINYTINLNANNNGTSNLILKCRPNGGSEFLNYVDVNNNYNQSSSFTLNYGDCMCYALSAYAGSGDNSNGMLKIDSVSGYGGFNTILNLSACETSISNSKAAEYILFSLTPDASPTANRSNGKINISPSIPNGDSINLTVSAITSIATATDNASVFFYKKPISSPSTEYTLVTQFAGNSTQNQKDIILPISYNEDYCYSLVVNAVNSLQCASIKLKSVNTVATSISPAIVAPFIDKIELVNVIPPKVIVHTYLVPNGNDWTCGRIVVNNSELNLVEGGNQYKKICVYYCADIANSCNPSLDADKNIYGSEVIIKRATVQYPYNFETIACHLNVRDGWYNQGNCTNGNTKGVGSFTINYNDIIEYCVCARSSGGIAILCLQNVTDGYTPISEGKIDARQISGCNMMLYAYDGDYCYIA